VESKNITNFGFGWIQGPGWQLKDGSRRKTYRDPPRTQCPNDFSNPIVAVEKRYINRPPHAKRMNCFTGSDPKSVARLHRFGLK
jgi:hypothetical protein